MKKVLALALAVVMLLSVTVYASEEGFDIVGGFENTEQGAFEEETNEESKPESMADESEESSSTEESSSSELTDDSSASEVTSSETESSEAESSEEETEEVDFYSPQPQNAEEVAALVAAYLANPEVVALPKWKHAIDETWVSAGWEQVQQTYTDDVEIMAYTYYTLQELPMMRLGLLSTTVYVSTEQELIDALDAVPVNATDYVIEFVGDITLSENFSYTINKSANITIGGDGHTLNVSASTSNSTFRISENDTVKFRDLEIYGPNKDNIGGTDEARFLISDGNVILSGAIIEGFYVNSNSSGFGAVILMNKGTLTIEEVTFTYNEAISGGVIYAWQGDITINNAHFTYNTAYGNGGAGGAICIFENATLTITYGIMWGNTAEGVGGAICTVFDTVTITMEYSDLMQNTAGTGGAIKSAGPIIIIDSFFTFNRATDGHGGGALVLYDDSIIEGTLFDNNVAEFLSGDGGAIYYHTATFAEQRKTGYITNCSFIYNNAQGSGGAIYAYQGLGTAVDLYINNSEFNGNTAGMGGWYWNETDPLVDPIDPNANESLNNQGQDVRAGIIASNHTNNKFPVSDSEYPGVTYTNLFNNHDIDHPVGATVYFAGQNATWESGTSGTDPSGLNYKAGFFERNVPITTAVDADLPLGTPAGTTTDTLTKPGYRIEGWYREYDPATDTYAKPWDIMNDVVRGSMILYPKWVPLAGTDCVVTFETYGGTPISDMTVAQNTKLPTVPATTKAGHTFAGWHADAAYTTPIDVTNHVVTQSQTLHAKWVPTGDSSGGTTPTPPAPPTKPPIKAKPPAKQPYEQAEEPECPKPCDRILPIIMIIAVDQAEEVDCAGWNSAGWSLVNLITVVAGAILCIITLIEWIRTRGKKKHTKFYVGITALAFIVTLILFIITENMKLPMVLVNRFTIIYCILALVEIATIIKTVFEKEDDKKEVYIKEEDGKVE